MVSGINVLNPTPYGSMVNGGVGSGKIYVQVKPNQVVYSQFEHVSGYASSKNPDSGVSVSKISKTSKRYNKAKTSYRFNWFSSRCNNKRLSR